MRPIRLKMEGFRAYGEPIDLDLSDVGGCTVTGPNSAGKSTLFDALLWALYGDTAEHSADSIVTLGYEAASVEAVFADSDGNTHTFSRRRKAGGQTAASYKGPAGSVSKATEVSAAAERLMGCDKEMWQMSCFARQGDLGRFSELAPAKRRGLLADMLIGRVFDGHTEEARQSLGEATAAENAAVAAEERLRAEAEQCDAAVETVMRATQNAKEADDRVEELRRSQNPVDHAALRRAEQAERDLAASKQTAVNARGQIVGLVKEVSEQADAKKAAEEALKTARERQGSAQSSAAALQARAKEAKKRLKSVVGALSKDGGKCPTCLGPLTPQKAVEIASSEQAIIKASDQASAQARQESAALASADRQCSSASSNHVRAEKMLAKAQQDLAVSEESAKRLEGPAATAPELRKIAQSGGATDAEVAAAERAARSAHQATGAAQQRVESALQAKTDLPGAEKAVAEARVKREACEVLDDSLRAAGMPHLLLSQRTKHIEAQINSVLARLRTSGDGRFLEMRLRMSHHTSNNPTLGIDVNCGGDGWLDYTQMSGGMRTRVDLAVRVALLRASGVQCRTLIIDEGTAMLDPPGVESLMDAVRELLAVGLIDSVYLITHDERLAGMLPANIAVTTSGGGTSTATITAA